MTDEFDKLDETNEDDLSAPKKQVLYIKLVTGDEIVGDCLGEDPNGTVVILKTPMLLSEVINPLSQTISITLSKYMIFGDYEFIPIKNTHIISMTKVVPELEDFYKSSVVFNQEVATKEIANELSRANMATKRALKNELSLSDDPFVDMLMDEDDEEELSLDLEEMTTTPNTTIH